MTTDDDDSEASVDIPPSPPSPPSPLSPPSPYPPSPSPPLPRPSPPQTKRDDDDDDDFLDNIDVADSDAGVVLPPSPEIDVLDSLRPSTPAEADGDGAEEDGETDSTDVIEPDDPSLPSRDLFLPNLSHLILQHQSHEEFHFDLPFELLGQRWNLQIRPNQNRSHVGLFLEYLCPTSGGYAIASPTISFGFTIFHRRVIAEAQAALGPDGDLTRTLASQDKRNFNKDQLAPTSLRIHTNLGWHSMLPHGDVLSVMTPDLLTRIRVRMELAQPKPIGVRSLATFINHQQIPGGKQWKYVGLNNQGATWSEPHTRRRTTFAGCITPKQ